MSVLFTGCSQLSTTAHGNELAIGKCAKTNAPVIIPMVEPVNLNWKPRDEVLGMRAKEVGKFRSLLLDSYEPGELFDQMEDRKPWWGLHGLHIYRQGNRAIEGPSKESVYLLNPFRLVAAEANNIGIWKAGSLSPRDLNTPGFPFNWNSGPLKFDSRNSMAQVTYDVTGYHRALAKWIPKLRGDTVIQDFSLIAYNARDFGMNFMYLDSTRSLNVQPWASKDAFEIPQMIHCGGSCGYPGGCNNMSPHKTETDNNRLKKLPARAYLKLWRDRPRDPITAPADFAMVIDFI